MHELSRSFSGYVLILALMENAIAVSDSPSFSILPINPVSPPINKTCTRCMFEVEASTTLSYPHEVHTATSVVEIVPYITIYPNTTVTSHSTLTSNATALGVNATTTGESRASLSAELLWTWSGATLTYPTVYIGYDPKGLMGAIPRPTGISMACHESAEFLFATDATLDYSNFAYPTNLPMGIAQTTPTGGNPGGAEIMRQIVPGTGKVQSVMPELLNYLEALPEISSIYSGHDIRTCTKLAVAPSKSAPNVGNVPEAITFAPPVMKTSVLLLQTSTKAPIIKTADVSAPAPPPPPPQQTTLPVAPVVPVPLPTPENKIGVPVSAIPALTNPAPGVAAPIVPASSTVKPIAGLSNLGNAIISALGVSVPSPAKAAQAGVTPAPSGMTPAPVVPLAISITGQKVTNNSAGQFVVAPGTTLTPGGPAQVIAGSTISIGFSPAGSTIAVINGQTSTLSGAIPTFKAAPALTIDGTTYAPLFSAGSTFYEVDGTTLAPGQVATVHGTTLSLGGGGGVLVINGVASFIPKATSSSIQYFESAAVKGEVAWTAGILIAVVMLSGIMI